MRARGRLRSGRSRQLPGLRRALSRLLFQRGLGPHRDRARQLPPCHEGADLHRPRDGDLPFLLRVWPATERRGLRLSQPMRKRPLRPDERLRNLRGRRSHERLDLHDDQRVPDRELLPRWDVHRRKRDRARVRRAALQPAGDAGGRVCRRSHLRGDVTAQAAGDVRGSARCRATLRARWLQRERLRRRQHLLDAHGRNVHGDRRRGDLAAASAGRRLHHSEYLPNSLVVQVGYLRTARLHQLSRKRPGRRRHLTVKLAALLLAAAALGCDTTTTVCGGIATCYSTQASRCGNAQGCTSTPVCMTDPSFGQDCALATTQDDCLVNVTAKFCVWSNGVCSGPCTQALDMATCQSTPTCTWSTCSGTPKPCSAYSVASCPTSDVGGCSVMTFQNGRLFE